MNYFGRVWSVPELRPRAATLHHKLLAEAPALIEAIAPIMAEVRADCPDSKAAILFARRIVEALQNFVNTSGGPDAESSSGSSPEHSTQSVEYQQEGESDTAGETASAIKSLLTKPAGALPAGIGQQLESILTAAKAKAAEGALLQVAEVRPSEAAELLPSILAETKCTTAALRHRLQNLLQATTLRKTRLGHRGRLDNGSLHKLFINDPKLFRRSGARIGLDTAVHLLIDVSSSMTRLMYFVSAISYCLCDALAKVPGLNLAATAFPGAPSSRSTRRDQFWETVSPILKHGQALHSRFQLTAEGSTPMGEAIWWVLQEMSALKQNRKIILILTDGDPDHIDNTKTAIAEARRLGYEIYGLGLDSDSVKSLLPGRSAVINQLADLPQAMFGLLGAAIAGKENS